MNLCVAIILVAEQIVSDLTALGHPPAHVKPHTNSFPYLVYFNVQKVLFVLL